jgi:hypothetical protein
VNRLARAVAARGTLPRGAVLAPPLARGVVWAPRLRGGPRLCLTVPFAYAVPEGAILPPDHRISPKATPEEAARIAEALAHGRRLGDRLARLVSVTVPRLRACQRLPRAAACRLEAPER